MPCEEGPILTKNAPPVYKKRIEIPDNFWFRRAPQSKYFMDLLPALFAGFIAWPVMMWFWTRTKIAPIFSIPVIFTLLIYMIISQQFDLYLLFGYVGFFVSAPLWFIFVVNQSKIAEFETPLNPKDWHFTEISIKDVDSDK